MGPVLFADSKDRPEKHRELPRDWQDRKLANAALALGAIGLWDDLVRIREIHGDRLPKEQVARLSDDRARQIIGTCRGEAPAKAIAAMLPLVRLAADMTLDLRALLAPAFEGWNNGASVRGWLMFHWHRLGDRPAEAAREAGNVAAGPPCDQFTAAEYLKILNGLGRFDDAAGFILQYGGALGAAALPPGLALLLALALRDAGQAAAAAPILRELAGGTYGPSALPVPAHAVTRALNEAMTLQRVSEGPEASLATLESWLASNSESPALLARRIRLIWRVQGLDAAAGELHQALEKAPLSPDLMGTATAMPFSDAVVGEVVDNQMRMLADGRDLSRAAAFRLLRLALRADRMEAAHRLAGMTDADHVTRLLLSGRLRQSGRLAENWAGAPFQIAETPGATAVILLFPGIERAFSGIPPRMLDTFLANRGVNAVYCQDASNLMFLRGIPGLGETWAAVANELRALPVVARADRLMTLGISFSGFAAMKMGLGLGAGHCLVYSPKTVLAGQLGDQRDLRFERSAEVFRSLPRQETDLSLSWPAETGMRTRLYHGAAIQLDIQHARRLEGCAGVSLIPCADVSGHDSFGPQLENGNFEKTLDSTLQEAPGTC